VVYSVSDTMIGDVYLREGDQLKCEEMNTERIREAISIVRKNIQLKENTTVALFHLDELQTRNFKNEELSSFYTDFSK
jgi:allophanate hydrolase subunit 2